MSQNERYIYYTEPPLGALELKNRKADIIKKWVPARVNLPLPNLMARYPL